MNQPFYSGLLQSAFLKLVRVNVRSVFRDFCGKRWRVLIGGNRHVTASGGARRWRRCLLESADAHRVCSHATTVLEGEGRRSTER